MPGRKRNFLRLLVPFGVFAVALATLLGRRGDEWEYELAHQAVEVDEAPRSAPQAPRRKRSRYAVAAAFTTLFFAGAAFTAGAGDQMVRLTDEDAAALEAANADPAAETPAPDAAVDPAAAPAPEQSAAPEAAAPEAAAPEAAAPEAAAAPEVVAPAAAPEAAAPAEAPAPTVATAAEPAAEAAAPAAAPSVPKASSAQAPASRSAKPPTSKPAAPAKKPGAKSILKRAAAPAPVPEIEREHGEPTIWLNRALPDPTPASARLKPSFARKLKTTAKRHGADWAAMLAVLRADGHRGSVPATQSELDRLADRLAGRQTWRGALALSGRTDFADQAAALADLYRSVGLQALVTGLEKAKVRLTKRLLEAEGVLIYQGGREDLEAGRVDVRVVVLLGYLAKRYDRLTVSSLFSGHRMFARPGVVSAHMYGHAVDVAAVAGTSIAGHQQPGGVTEDAVRSILLLPSELQPRQVISLLGLGGPSFPLRDHGDHIHIGY
jgi:hypothetical protein